MGSAHEVLAESSETVFDEAHFIVNLHSFLQSLALSRHTFPPSESCVPHPPRQNNFQNSSPLETSETVLVCILYSILNHIGKSKEFNNQELKVNRNFKYCILFLA